MDMACVSVMFGARTVVGEVLRKCHSLTTSAGDVLCKDCAWITLLAHHCMFLPVGKS